ncbi:MAG TPA: hypothetical protein VFZ70_01795 [Euzebyales bacterium]
MLRDGRIVVGVTAGAHLAVPLAVAGRYGYHRDELYFLEPFFR